MAKRIETVTVKGKTYTKASIRDMLLANDAWLYRAMLARLQQNRCRVVPWKITVSALMV